MGDRGALELPLKTSGFTLYPISSILYPAPAQPGLAPRMSYPLVQNGRMNSMRKAQKTTRPEATLEWGWWWRSRWRREGQC